MFCWKSSVVSHINDWIMRVWKIALVSKLTLQLQTKKMLRAGKLMKRWALFIMSPNSKFSNGFAPYVFFETL